MRKIKWIPALVAMMTGVAALADGPDVKAILTKVDATTKAVKEISYSAKLSGDGALANDVPAISGVVKLQRNGESLIPKINVDATKGDTKVSLVCDGKKVLLVNHTDKRFQSGELPEAGGLLRDFQQSLYMQEFMHPTPFSDELDADKTVHEGMKTIGGVECHVIYVVYNNGQGEARWYFGKDDNLPHRVERIIRRGDTVGARVLEIADVNPHPSYSEDTFKTDPPVGYDNSTPGSESTTLPVGSMAPSFELKSADGKVVKLSDLKGNVVVIDFWATWCGPCKIAMPDIQKLHESFKGKPVQVFGVNVWESEGADPAEFMKKNGYSYGLLLAGDDVAKAYKVNGIPTFYVIGPDGKVVFAQDRYTKDGAERMSKAIEQMLAKMQ